MKHTLKLGAFGLLVAGMFLALTAAIAPWRAWAQEVRVRGGGDPNGTATFIVTREHGDAVDARVIFSPVNLCCSCPGYIDPNGGQIPADIHLTGFQADPNTYTAAETCTAYYEVDTEGLLPRCAFAVRVTELNTEAGDPNSDIPSVTFWTSVSPDGSVWSKADVLKNYADANLIACATAVDPNDDSTACERIIMGTATYPRYLRIGWTTTANYAVFSSDPNIDPNVDPNYAVLYEDKPAVGKVWLSCAAR